MVLRLIVIAMQVLFFCAPTAAAAETIYLSGDGIERISVKLADRAPSIHVERRSVREVDERAPMPFVVPLKFASAPKVFEAFTAVSAKSTETLWGLLVAESNFSNSPNPLYRLLRIDLTDSSRDMSSAKKLISREEWGPVDATFGTALTDSQLHVQGGDYQCVDLSGGGFGSQYLRYGFSTARDPEVAKKARASLRVIDSRKCRLFALCEPASEAAGIWPKHDDRRLFVFDLEIRPGIDRRMPRPDEANPKYLWNGVWTRTRSKSADVVGSFETVAADDGDFLIVEDGNLYFADWKTPAASLRHVKLRGGQLIQALIYDLDRGRTAFAFTSQYWFEVKEPLEYRDFDVGELSADDSMPMLVRCAREVRRVFPAVPEENAKPGQ